MDDERKKPPGKGGHAAGGRKFGRSSQGGAHAKGGKRGAGGGGGKPGFAAKSDRPFGGAGKFKPKPRREGEASTGGQPAGGDRPFLRRPREAGDGARPERAERPVSRGPRPDGKPFRPRGEDSKRPQRYERAEKREAGDGARPERAERPVSRGPRPDGKPFRPRGEDSKRPQRYERAEKREAGDGARPERGERPVSRGPRPDGKPFRPRGEDSKRPQRYERAEKRETGDGARAERAERPVSRGPRPDGKPFRPRDEDGKRPGRYERAEKRETGDGARPERAGRPDRAEGNPFFKKREEGASHDAERPARRFERDHQRGEGDRPHRERFDKPAGAGRDSRHRPFEKHSQDGATPFAARKTFARHAAAPEEAGERIAKRLARVGIASRRDAEELIAAGRVRVNGKVLESPAFNVTAEDVIELDGQPLPPIERTRLFLFHKPAGVVTTSRDPEGRKTVFDVLPGDLPRLITVGRLDINTEGLLLLTNDGGLARTLELPATGWLRRYRVRVHGKVEEAALAGLKDGIAVDGVFYGSIEASLDREQGSNAWLTIGLREGKNREVKNILGSLGLDVTRLIRVSFGPFQLGDLPEGHVQELKGRMLRDQLGDRLIEESGANFDAEIVKPFSNRPAKRSEDPAERAAPREARPLRVGEGGLIKNRGRNKEHAREDALGRLSTRPDRGPEGRKPDRGPKPDFGDRPRSKKSGEREQRPIEPPGVRKANVWMAPGARPIGAGRAAAEKAAAEAKRARKPAYGKPGGAKPFGKPRGEGRDGGKPGGRPPHSGKPRKGQ